nr:hypothetical protein [Pseudomonas sp. BIGb0427]
MCITFELPQSGLNFYVCLYRGEHDAVLRKDGLFAAFCEQLLQLWRFQVQDMIRLDTGNAAADFAIARLDGSLYVGARVCAAIEQALPGWSGSLLPPQVCARNWPGRRA